MITTQCTQGFAISQSRVCLCSMEEKLEHIILCEAILWDYDLNFDQRWAKSAPQLKWSAAASAAALAENRVIFLFSSVRSWWNALSARKGQKWGMRGRVSAGWFTWRCVSHGQWAQQSARMQRKHIHKNYLLLRERHRDRISRRLMRHPPRIDNKSTAAHYPDAQNRITTCVRRACFCAKSHVPALWSGGVCVWFTRRDLISIRTATLIETRSVLRRPRGANGPIALTRTRISADPFYGHFHARAIISH